MNRRTIPVPRALAAWAVVLSFGAATAQSTSLADALDLAARNTSVTLAHSQVLSAKHALASASGLITASVSTGLSMTAGERTGAGGDVTNLNDVGLDPLRLNASLHLIPYGPQWDAVQRAQRQVTEAELMLRDARSNAVVTATQRYLAVLRAQQELALRRAALELAERQLEAAVVRYGAGAVTEGQRLDSELAVSEASNALAQALRQHAQALAQLADTIAAPVQSVEDHVLRAEVPPFDDGTPFLMARLDVVRATHGVTQAETAAAAAQRDALPAASLSTQVSTSNGAQGVSAGASIDTRSYQPSVTLSFDPNVAGAASRSIGFALSVSMPLNSATHANLESARLAVETSRAQAEQTRRAAELDVANALRAVEAASESVELSGAVVASRQRSLEVVRQRFDLGLVTELDVRQAELNVENALLSLRRNEDALLLAQLAYAQSLAIDPLEVLR